MCAGCNYNYYTSNPHICYFERFEKEEDEKYKDGIYVFDFESELGVQNEIGRQIHTVNYVVVKKLFDDDFILKMDTLDEFAAWLASMSDKEALVLAHNFRGYDGRLLLVKLLGLPQPDISTTERLLGMAQQNLNIYCESFVMVGSKLNSYKYGKLMFGDSLLHIAQPLHNFPSIFGVVEHTKGFFPYKFNLSDNQNYVGEIPPIEMFEPGKMSEKRRSEFLEWYEEVRLTEYDFRAEMIKYCVSDVDVMKRGLEVYITSSKQVNQDINPLDSQTIASAAYKIWRTLHMPEQIIAYYGESYHSAARKALRGGRTDVRCMYRSWSKEDVFVRGKYGVYADVQSMYPYIQMTKDLPVGKPRREYEKFVDTDFGIVHCDLQPPPKFQFHPALCIRDPESDRLVAPLRKSALTKIHITTVELKEALEQGYEIVKIHYVDIYEKSTDLFKDYIRKFLKIKVEKSQNYPGDEKFRELYDMYWTRCGVKLEAENFGKNPGAKQIAKLYLNSLWGKLCERPHYDYTAHVNAEGFKQLEEEEETGLYDPKLKMRLNDESWLIRGSKTAQNFWHEKADRDNKKKVSPAIGAFITMYGRGMLLEQMQQLGKRALYHDTDSIVYECEEGKYNIPLGKCLGDWEDELDGKPMIEFVAIAPKTYSYRYLDKPVSMDTECGAYWEWESRKYPVREVTKIKGVRQCFDTRASIDFNTLKELVDGTKEELLTSQLSFDWNLEKLENGMSTREIMKKTTFRYCKGEVGTDYFTYSPGVEQYGQWLLHRRCDQGAPIKT